MRGTSVFRGTERQGNHIFPKPLNLRAQTQNPARVLGNFRADPPLIQSFPFSRYHLSLLREHDLSTAEGSRTPPNVALGGVQGFRVEGFRVQGLGFGV